MAARVLGRLWQGEAGADPPQIEWPGKPARARAVKALCVTLKPVERWVASIESLGVTWERVPWAPSVIAEDVPLVNIPLKALAA